MTEKLNECTDENCEECTCVVQNAVKTVFRKKKRQQNNWFNDQDEEIQTLMKDKRMNRNSLRERIRKLKNDWFQKKAEKAERFSQEKNQRELYATLNTV